MVVHVCVCVYVCVWLCMCVYVCVLLCVGFACGLFVYVCVCFAFDCLDLSLIVYACLWSRMFA